MQQFPFEMIKAEQRNAEMADRRLIYGFANCKIAMVGQLRTEDFPREKNRKIYERTEEEDIDGSFRKCISFDGKSRTTVQ